MIFLKYYIIHTIIIHMYIYIYIYEILLFVTIELNIMLHNIKYQYKN